MSVGVVMWPLVASIFSLLNGWIIRISVKMFKSPSQIVRKFRRRKSNNETNNLAKVPSISNRFSNGLAKQLSCEFQTVLNTSIDLIGRTLRAGAGNARLQTLIRYGPVHPQGWPCLQDLNHAQQHWSLGVHKQLWGKLTGRGSIRFPSFPGPRHGHTLSPPVENYNRDAHLK